MEYMEKVVTINDVFKSYGENEAKVEALKNVSLDIEQGTFVTIVGKSGRSEERRVGKWFRKINFITCYGRIGKTTKRRSLS